MTPARQRALILGMILIGFAIAAVFGLRALHAFRQFRGHPPPPIAASNMERVETDVELIRGWMTVPYVSRMYNVPPGLLFDALGISPIGNGEKSLEQLNEEYYPQADDFVIASVKAAILEYQARDTPVATPVPHNPPIRPIGPIPP
ncbi:MAG: hypothetical protein L6Q26_00240 [Anaerolineales bacterium]|nr:hypothetical protein [Anaerolineales bacterium]NUQ83810.1 hypothetical protein [Anaerolineales bacterium]